MREGFLEEVFEGYLKMRIYREMRGRGGESILEMNGLNKDLKIGKYKVFREKGE